MKSLICLFISLVSLNAWGGLNSTCTQAFLEKLTVTTTTFNIPDVCLLDAKKIPQELVTTIKHIGALNASLAQTFNKKPTDLFGSGVKLTIRSDSSGPLSSVAGVISVFADWKGGEIEPFIYLHEMGHVILAYWRLPELIGLNRNTSFKEYFPDLVANTVLKMQPTDFFKTIKAPACAQIRSANIDFIFSQKEIKGYRESMDFVKCCDSVIPENYSTHFKILCDARKSFLSSYSNYSSAPAQVSDCVASGPATSGNPVSCPGHVFSRPIGNFLTQIANLLGTTTLKLLLDAVKIQNSMGDYNCTNTQTGVIKKPTGSPVRSMTEILSIIKSRLSSTDIVVFENLWKKHNLDFLAAIDDVEVNRWLQQRLNHYQNVCVNKKSSGCDYVCVHERPLP